MTQQLSDDEFHRMQLQIIEMRTENYQLKDENRKQTLIINRLTENESKLDKELKLQTKMKKALSTLNRSKQAEEFENILIQTEKEFSLQNQTLKQELNRVSEDITRLENENKSMKLLMSSTQDCVNDVNVNMVVDESKFRKLQAENSVLKSKIKKFEFKCEQSLTKKNVKDPDASKSNIIHDSLFSSSTELINLELMKDESFVHLQAQIERYKIELKHFQDMEVTYSTCIEEHKLLEEELFKVKEHSVNEQKVLESEIDILRSKLSDYKCKFEDALKDNSVLTNKISSLQKTNQSDEKRIRMNEVDELNEEISSLKKLAEKRKLMVDQQAIEIQEKTIKFNDMCVSMQLENEQLTEKLRVSFDEKFKKLQSKCNHQEKDLNKLHQLERSKTKEIESLQQEIQQMIKNRDLLMSSEEMLKRALQEMEEKIKTINKQNEENIVQLNQKHFEKLSNIETIIMSKNDLICKNERQIKEVREAGKATEEEVLKLRQEVKDRDDILTVIKKKEKAVLKDIKRQLLNEKRKNEKLQEKFKEISRSQTDLDELLGNTINQIGVKEQSSGGSSEISSLSFQETSKSSNQQFSITHHVPLQISTDLENSQLSKRETSDLLQRIAKLQEEKSNMEERLEHLEASCTSMATELLEKTELVQHYVGKTRTDAPHKVVKESLGLASSTKKIFTNKLKNLVTNQNEELEIKNLHQLNKKLTRILEEEFTKNTSLKQDLIAVTNQLEELKTSI